MLQLLKWMLSYGVINVQQNLRFKCDSKYKFLY